MTAKDAAARLGLSEVTIRLYIREGRIKATRFANVWSIDEVEVKRFAKLPRVPGWHGQKRNPTKGQRS